MELKSTIAAWIKQARTGAGMSGSDLGTKLALELGDERGHSKANISHWETEKHCPNMEQLLAIVKITKTGLPDEVVAALRGGTSGAANAAPPARASKEVDDPQLAFAYAQVARLVDLFGRTDDRGRDLIMDHAASEVLRVGAAIANKPK